MKQCIGFLTLMLMSVFVPDARCEVGNLQPFSEVNRIEVKSGWAELTDVCTIDMPKNIRVRQDDETLIELNSYLKRGDAVKIVAGYNGTMQQEFRGFVRTVNKSIPLRIECEDYMYLLKLDTYKMSWRSTDLKTVVNHLLTGKNISEKKAQYPFTVEVLDDVQLGDFAIPNISGARVLQHIKEQYGLVSYFRLSPDPDVDPVLVVGFRYPVQNQVDTWLLTHGRNVIEWNLAYQNADEVQVKIKAISNLKNGKKLIVEVGDPEGETRTRNYPEITKDQLTTFANDELKNVKRDGFSGEITIPGEPMVRHGDRVVIDDPIYTKEIGAYFVDATIWEYTESPTIKRKLSLGLRG